MYKYLLYISILSDYACAYLQMTHVRINIISYVYTVYDVAAEIHILI